MIASQVLRRLYPGQSFAIAVATDLAALTAVTVAWTTALSPALIGGWKALLVAACLIVAAVVAYHFPLHVSRRTKVYVSSVPHFLLAVLLPPPLAATAAGAAVLLGELSVRGRTGNTYGDVATQVGRRMLVVLAGAIMAHQGGSSALHSLALIAAAFILGGGDILTSPLILMQTTGEPPLRIILSVTRRAYLIEGMQYLLGILGALAALREFWMLGLLIPPTALVYLAYRASMRAEEAQQIAEEARARAEATQEALIHQALHDTLTGLPNRTLLHDRLQQALLVASRDSVPLALLLLDLDRFKEINDTFGHDYGDALLQQAATRLNRVLRASDAVARLGGDEFAILLPTDDAEGASRVARKIATALDEPFMVEGHSLHVEGSIGIALYPEHGSDPPTLLRHADVAMYAAKRARSGYAVYDPLQDQLSPTRHAVISALRQAIEHNQLVLQYQPTVDVASSRLHAVEALVRWAHPEEGMLSPDHFIPLAEHTGLIIPLSHWVLEAALSQRQAWQRAGLDLTMTVNLSMANLQEQHLVPMITELLRRCEVPPAGLRIEITESALMADPGRTLLVLNSLSKLGVRISIDDFGTGYSSLAYLKSLPVDELKIDKSFVEHMIGNPTDAVIVRSTIGLAHGLGLHVVAEGVEDRRTYRMLSGLGCDAVQGYYVAIPMPAPQLERWLQRSPYRTGGEMENHTMPHNRADRPFGSMPTAGN